MVIGVQAENVAVLFGHKHSSAGIVGCWKLKSPGEVSAITSLPPGRNDARTITAISGAISFELPLG
jgi:hypothetical protein